VRATEYLPRRTSSSLASKKKPARAMGTQGAGDQKDVCQEQIRKFYETVEEKVQKMVGSNDRCCFGF